MNAIKNIVSVSIAIIFWCHSVWCIAAVHGDGGEQRQSATVRTVDDFLRQFVNLLQQGYPAPASRQRDGSNDGGGGGYLGAFPPLRPPPLYGAGFGARPAPFYPLPNYPPYRPPPGLYGYPRPPGVNNYIPRPPYPLRPLGYPHNSLFAALDSISRYDDLRCVPRLLCEVTTGSHPKINGPVYRPGGGHVDDGSSPVPFLSRDALVTLLTVLNFVDDSPILSFARAAFLGYSSRGDLRACLTAYPTCPRDPDQLIDYLNNHNGGFFRFFNQQLQQQPQYAPQYQQFVQKYHHQQQQTQQAYDDDQRQQTSTPSNAATEITPRYADNQRNPNSRILNDPIDIQYVGGGGGGKESALNILGATTRLQSKIVFQHNAAVPDQVVEPQSYESVGVRAGKRIVFPEQSEKASSYSTIFPNRTGTGNLILSSDANGHLKILFEGDKELTNRVRTSKSIRFQADKPDGYRSKRRMKFPDEGELA